MYKKLYFQGVSREWDGAIYACIRKDTLKTV